MPERLPTPPFSKDDAIIKIRMAEDAWNSRNPARIAQAYTPDSKWRNRSTFLQGRDAIIAFLTDKWVLEHDYRLIKEYWAHDDDRIAVRFAYEFHDDSEQWFRAYGNENWLFDAQGYMSQRHASINDIAITHQDRRFHWDRTMVRPIDHPGLTALGL